MLRNSLRSASTLSLSLVLLACREPDTLDDAEDTTTSTVASTGGSTGESTDEGNDDSTTGAAIDPYACQETMRQEGGPLAGAGYDPEMGLLPPLQDSYVAHSTQIFVKPDQLERFGEIAGEVSAQLQQAEGLVAYTYAIDPTCGFQRTLGVWRSEEDMYKFVLSGAHAAAMAETTAVSTTGKVTHWTVAADAMPIDWDDALAKLAAAEPSGVYE